MADPYWGSVKLLLNFEGADQSTTISDGSPFTKVVEAIGNAKLVTSEKKFGNSCLYLDGSGDYLRIPTDDNNYLWSTYRNDFTIEMFLKTTDTYASLFDITQGTYSWHLYLSGSGKIVWYSPSYGNIYGTLAINDNTWHHIAFCRKGNDYRIYIDGTQDASVTSSLSFYSLPTYFQIGSQIGGSSYDYQGYIDCLRYSMFCRYWSGSQRFVPSTTEYSQDANTVLLLHFEGTDGSTTFTDSSSSPKTVTPYNATIGTAQKKIGDSSCYFPAGTGRLYIDHPDMAMGSGDFTVECWLRPTSLSYDWATIARFGTHSTNGCWAIARSGNSNPMVVEVDYYYYGWKGFVATSLTCPLDTWTHVAVCRKNGAVGIFINGVPSGGSVYVNPAVDANFNQTSLYLGADSNYGECFIGYMDEFRVTKGVARYWGDFDVPTEAFTEEGPIDATDPYYNNIILYCGDNDGTSAYDLSPSRKGILQLGYGNTANAAVLGPSGSFYTSSSTYVFQPAFSKDWALGTGDFTIEAFTFGRGTGSKWTLSTLGIFFYFGEVGEVGGFYCGWAANENPARLKFYLYDGTLILTSNGTFTDNYIWYHISVVRNNGVLYLYINGVLDSSVAFTYDIYCNSVYFGNSSNKAFPSYIYCDELRVTKGVARYTSNFEVNRFYKLDIGNRVLYTLEDEIEDRNYTGISNPSLYLPSPSAQSKDIVAVKTLPIPWWEGGDVWNEIKIPTVNKEGIFSGTVKVGLIPKAGVKVLLFHRKTGKRIAGTISDSEGNFSFSSVGVNNAVSDYFAVALPDDDYNAVVYDKLKPI